MQKRNGKPSGRWSLLQVALFGEGLLAKKNAPEDAFFDLAEWTGLEPATPGVTGRYSNQLNYHSW
jgi:hypothetical protein